MDNLFKALLIIILVAFLYLYYENSDNGRYIKYTAGKESFNLLDTKTGKVYYRGDKIYMHDILFDKREQDRKDEEIFRKLDAVKDDATFEERWNAIQ